MAAVTVDPAHVHEFADARAFEKWLASQAASALTCEALTLDTKPASANAVRTDGERPSHKGEDS